jgi:5-methylcytosine-specific restriction protein A
MCGFFCWMIMPTRAPIFRRAAAPSRQQQKQNFDRFRRKSKPWRLWYGRKEWKARRAAQLTTEPYCKRCQINGRIVLATVANHIIAHRGDWELFIGGALESLCKRCHDRDVQAEERAAARDGEGD